MSSGGESAQTACVQVGDSDTTHRPCAYCGASTGDVEDVTITDESGGASAGLCASCRAFATTPRCVLCGGLKSQHTKADALFLDLGSGEGDGIPICDRCRDRMLFPRGEVR